MWQIINQKFCDDFFSMSKVNFQLYDVILPQKLIKLSKHAPEKYFLSNFQFLLLILVVKCENCLIENLERVVRLMSHKFE